MHRENKQIKKTFLHVCNCNTPDHLFRPRDQEQAGGPTQIQGKALCHKESTVKTLASATIPKSHFRCFQAEKYLLTVQATEQITNTQTLKLLLQPLKQKAHQEHS